MNSRVYFAIHCVIGLAALAVLGYAFSQPLANLEINENNIKVSSDIYITQECLSASALGMANESKCNDLDSVFKSQMQALMGIVIALMICIVLECISMNFSSLVSNILGVLVLGLSITLIILVAMLSYFSRTTLYNNKTNYYTLTNTSIGVLVIASLLILFELCCNKLIHRAVLAPYKMITSKKA